MTLDAMNNCLQMVTGLPKATRARARAAANAMLAQAGLDGVAADAGERAGKLAQEIMNAGRANRELLEKVVAGEVDKAAARLGFARASELETLREEVAELRRAVAGQHTAGNGATAQPAPATLAAARTRRTARVRKAATGTATAKKAGKRTAAKSAAPRKAAARRAPASQAAPESAEAATASAEAEFESAPAEFESAPAEPESAPAESESAPAESAKSEAVASGEDIADG